MVITIVIGVESDKLYSRSNWIVPWDGLSAIKREDCDDTNIRFIRVLPKLLGRRTVAIIH